jgi:Ssp1 endopeptidase immunity protein Rap1a
MFGESMKRGLALSLLLLPCVNADALESAQELLSACRPIAKADVRGGHVFFSPTFQPTFQTGQCWGTFSAIQKVIFYVDIGVCAPPESTLSQLVAVFVSYAEKHPQRLHEAFFDVALNSLQEAFPCPSHT